MVERLGIPFHGVLARSVQGHERRRDQAHDRADVDDPSGPLPTHDGKHGLGHSNQPEQVDLEERLRLLQR